MRRSRFGLPEQSQSPQTSSPRPARSGLPASNLAHCRLSVAHPSTPRVRASPRVYADGMKARRAIVNDGVLGTAYLVTGIVSFALGSARAGREFDAFAAVVLGSVHRRCCRHVRVGYASASTGSGLAPGGNGVVDALRHWSGHAVRRSAPWRDYYISTSPDGAISALGLGCVALGLAMSSLAAGDRSS